MSNKIALWIPQSNNVKAPVLSGSIEISREDVLKMAREIGDKGSMRLSVAVWNGKSDAPKAPKFTGVVSYGDKKVDQVEASAAPKVEVKKIKTQRQPKAAPQVVTQVDPAIIAAVIAAMQSK